MVTKSISKPATVLLLCLCAFSGAADRMRFPPPATGTSHNWEMCEPEEERVDSARLQRAMEYLRKALDDPKTADDREDGIKYACLIRNGRMIWPNSSTPTGQGSDLNVLCQIYSATKTFGTGVLGLLIDQGLASLDMPVNPIIDIDLTQEDGRGEKEYPAYDRITLRHLATFTDGYADVRPKWPAPGMYYPFDPEPSLFVPPGSKYAYNSSPQLLSYCMTKLIYNHFGRDADRGRLVNIRSTDYLFSVPVAAVQEQVSPARQS